MFFSIIIPVFNEELNIISLVDEIFLYLKDFKNNYELILVNDASQDRTKNIIQSLITKYPENLKYLENKINLGQSYSIIEGIQSSKYETIVTIDGDGQNNPKDIPLLLNKYFSDDEVFLVGGIRIKRKDTYIKIISSKIANSIRGIILNDQCPDTGCSLKVFDKKIFMNFPFFNGIHRFLPALFKGYGKKTYFMNVDHRPRVFGQSNYGTMGRLFQGIKDLIKVAKIIKSFKDNCD